MENSAQNKNKRFWILFIVFSVLFVAAVVVFTFYDYEITSALYNKGSAFGIIAEVSGPAFMPFFGIFALVSTLFVVKPKNKYLAAGLYFALFILYAYYFIIGAFTFKHSYAPFMFIPSMVLFVLWTAACVFINLKMKEDKKGIHKIITLIIFFTVLASMLGVDLIKLIFGRKRFYTIESEAFKPWYVIQSHEFNSSFPSGHVARAAVAICFALIPYYFDKNAKLSYLIGAIAVLFTLAVAVSRLCEGMHYPTDVLTGMYITFATFFICKNKLLKTHKRSD